MAESLKHRITDLQAHADRRGWLVEVLKASEVEKINRSGRYTRPRSSRDVFGAAITIAKGLSGFCDRGAC